MKEMNLLEKIIAILLLIEIIGVIVGIIIKRIELITLFMGLGVITYCICPDKKRNENKTGNSSKA